ncbi:hypothetical protein HPB51_025154 [Rhipicephalus microplus]|uniref:Transposase n=1 Tax=Rhipicephalus microplus TaxID=6941 RepID=A0A9J6F8Y9_RHIMP|nr:hypothetical protein HPB51_025154 [Rhipicephalus microplus]
MCADFFRRNEIPTVEKITSEFSERRELPSIRWCTVRRLLADIGFIHEKRSLNSLLIDRDDMTDRRNRYLRDGERYRTEAQKCSSWTRHQSRRNTLGRLCG